MTDLGTLHDVDGRPTIRFERHLRAPVERVWHAVTDETEMRSWFPAGVVGERRVGAPLRFPFDQGEADTFDGEVLAWEPMRRFAFDWNGEEIHIELSPAGDHTVLVFTHRLEDVSEAARTGSGWHMCLANLGAHLDGSSADVEWRDVLDDYLDRMGPPLAVRRDGALVFERAHHAPDDELVERFEPWRADGVRFDVQPQEHGTRYSVTVRTDDPVEAARWHAELIAFDMYAASHERISVDPEPFLADYEKLLA